MTQPTRFKMLDIHPEIKNFIRFVSENDSAPSIPLLESLAEGYAALNPASFLDSQLVHISTEEIVGAAANKHWDIEGQWETIRSIVESISKAESIDDTLIEQLIEEAYEDSPIAIRNRIAEGEVVTSFGYSSWKREIAFLPVKMELTGTVRKGCLLEDLSIEVDKPFDYLGSRLVGHPEVVIDLISKWHSLLNPGITLDDLADLGHRGTIYLTYFVGGHPISTKDSIDKYGMDRVLNFLRGQEGKRVTIGVLLRAESPKVIEETIERGRL